MARVNGGHGGASATPSFTPLAAKDKLAPAAATNMTTDKGKVKAAVDLTRPLKKSSRFRGVSWHKKSELWQVCIFHQGQSTSVGQFEDEVEAALAYDKLAKRFGKECNFDFAEAADGGDDTRGVAVEATAAMEEARARDTMEVTAPAVTRAAAAEAGGSDSS